MATRDDIALRLDTTMWLLGAGMWELPLPLYDKLIDYREELKEALGPGRYSAISGKLKEFIEKSRKLNGLMEKAEPFMCDSHAENRSPKNYWVTKLISFETEDK